MLWFLNPGRRFCRRPSKSKLSGKRVVDFLGVENYNGDGVRQKERELGWILNTNLGWETERKWDRGGSKGSPLKNQASRKQKFNTDPLRNIVQKTLHTYLPLMFLSVRSRIVLRQRFKYPYWNSKAKSAITDLTSVEKVHWLISDILQNPNVWK